MNESQAGIWYYQIFPLVGKSYCGISNKQQTATIYCFLIILLIPCIVFSKRSRFISIQIDLVLDHYVVHRGASGDAMVFLWYVLKLGNVSAQEERRNICVAGDALVLKLLSCFAEESSVWFQVWMSVDDVQCPVLLALTTFQVSVFYFIVLQKIYMFLNVVIKI